MKTGFNLLFILLLLMPFLSACSNDKENTPIEQAKLIRLSINNNNSDQLRTLSSLPLLVSTQEWTSSDDGYGFVLGDSKQIELTTDKEFQEHFKATINSIHIQGEQVISDISLNIFTEELKDQIKRWDSLNLYLLKRGEGDVEHIVLLGLNKNTNKLRAIYIN